MDVNNIKMNAWVTISVDRIKAPCESQPVFGLECPICGKKENILAEGMDMNAYFDRVHVKHDCAFVLCPECYDYVAEKIGEAIDIYNG